MLIGETLLTFYIAFLACLIQDYRVVILCVQPPVLGGRYTKAVPKGGAEYTFTGEAGLETDILYGHSGIFQQIFCGADPGMDDIFVGGKASVFFESADEMILAETGNIRQFFY